MLKNRGLQKKISEWEGVSQVYTHCSTPPDHCGLGPVLSLGEGLLWKFNGQKDLCHFTNHIGNFTSVDPTLLIAMNCFYPIQQLSSASEQNYLVFLLFFSFGLCIMSCKVTQGI